MKGTATGLRVCHFGTEEIKEDAKWGPGARNVYIFHYILEGKGFFNGIPLEKHQGFLIRANELVEYHYNETDPWRYFWVIFEGDAAEEICQKYMKADANGIFCYDFADKLISMVARLFASVEALSQTEALALFFYLLSLHEEKNTVGSNRYVSEAKNYMHLHIHQPFTITEVAKVLGISDRYLYNLFICYEGVSPKQYITALRLQNAKDLLKNSSYTITEIGISVGFSDVLTFSRFFARNEGISPSAYRRKLSLS